MREKILNKKSLANMVLVFFPIIVMVTIAINYSNQELMMKSELNYLGLIMGNSLYFIFLVIFLYLFFIKKQEYSLFALLIGLVELIIVLFPRITHMISYDLFVRLYSELHLTIILCGGILLMYLLLLLQYTKLKKDNNLVS